MMGSVDYETEIQGQGKAGNFVEPRNFTLRPANLSLRLSRISQLFSVALQMRLAITS